MSRDTALSDKEEVLYLDTSAALRAVMEHGASPEIDRDIANAEFLVTSRLSFVEGARAIHRLRTRGVSEQDVADVARELDSIWSRCTVWEMTREVMRLAEDVAPRSNLRSLDAIHLATFHKARRAIGPEVRLLTADHRLLLAATGSIDR